MEDSLPQVIVPSMSTRGKMRSYSQPPPQPEPAEAESGSTKPAPPGAAASSYCPARYWMDLETSILARVPGNPVSTRLEGPMFSQEIYCQAQFPLVV